MFIAPRHPASSNGLLHRLARIALGLTALAGFALSDGPSIGAETGHPFDLSVESASAKVGERTAITATITMHEGFKISDAYNNRIIELSSWDDDAVDFEEEVVLGSVQDGSLVFSVGVIPTKPGAHAINGVFRVGYHNGERMAMVSVPLIATVTGTK